MKQFFVIFTPVLLVFSGCSISSSINEAAIDDSHEYLVHGHTLAPSFPTTEADKVGFGKAWLYAESTLFEAQHEGVTFFSLDGKRIPSERIGSYYRFPKQHEFLAILGGEAKKYVIHPVNWRFTSNGAFYENPRKQND